VSDSCDDDDPGSAEALFRYHLIADALEAPRGGRAAILRTVAAEEHVAPDGQLVTISQRTLERWLERFEAEGLGGLMRTVRKDRGKPRAIPSAALARAVQLRQEQPGRSTSTLIDALERSGEVAPGALRRSTVDRHLDRLDASRRRMHVLGAKVYGRLEFAHPLDFVVADFHVGPYVRADDGQIRRSRLCAFIDHCSRFLPESRYGLAEDLMSLRRGLRAFILAWALIVKLYVDHGSAFQAGRFHFGCAQLGIHLIHSRPYTSEGRGVIERFNRTTKEAFETEVRLRREPPTLEELNAFWAAWREERYHRVNHSETGEPPRERWERLLEKTERRHADPVLLDEVLRLRTRRRVHKKTVTAEVCGVPFAIDPALRGRKVDLLYDPHDLSSVLVYFDGRRLQRAVPQRPGERPVVPPPAVPPPPTLDYLALVRRDHERRRAAETAGIRFAAVAEEGKTLSLPRLLDRLRTLCAHPLGAVEQAHAAAVLTALAPVDDAVADLALKAAAAALGCGLHAAQYLDALRAHVLRARRIGAP